MAAMNFPLVKCKYCGSDKTTIHTVLSATGKDTCNATVTKHKIVCSNGHFIAWAGKNFYCQDGHTYKLKKGCLP